MLRYVSYFLLGASSLFVLSCGDSGVKTEQIVVDYDRTFDFSQLQTFSVVTQDVAPPGTPEPGPDEVFFNNLVNDLIIEAMTSEPVCMELIPANELTETNQPDVWAANGLAKTTGEGVVWECVGGWWWGYWGWRWDSCAWVTPVPVEFDVGNLFVPVGPAPQEGEDPAAIFAGLAQSVAGTGPDVETKVRAAVQEIFQSWPEKRSCPVPQ